MAVFIKNPKGWNYVTRDPRGPFGRDMARRGRQLQLLAMRQVGVDTGRLRNSIKVDMDYGAPSGPKATVGSSLSYARAHHDGTRAHEIVPRKAKVLRFTQNGAVRYAMRVWHPGNKPNKFLTDNLRRVVND